MKQYNTCILKQNEKNAKQNEYFQHPLCPEGGLDAGLLICPKIENLSGN
jgi:hypothetical protein